MALDRFRFPLPFPICQALISCQEVEDNLVGEEWDIKFLISYFSSRKILHFFGSRWSIQLKENTTTCISNLRSRTQIRYIFPFPWDWEIMWRKGFSIILHHLMFVEWMNLFWAERSSLIHRAEIWRGSLVLCGWQGSRCARAWQGYMTFPGAQGTSVSLETSILPPPARASKRKLAWRHWTEHGRPRLQRQPCHCPLPCTWGWFSGLSGLRHTHKVWIII